jgi:hypothetical protein
VCIETLSDSKIKVSENGRCAVILNHARENINRVKIDGCIECDGKRADWAIEKGHSSVIIELKGKNVEEAVEQIFSSAKLWANIEKRSQKVSGLIVCSQYPRTSSRIMIRQERFAKEFSSPLHIVTKNYEYEFENLLSFKGPHKRT